MGKFAETKLGIYARDLAQLKGQEDRIFKIVLDNRQFTNLIETLNTTEQLGQSIDSKGNPLFSSLTQRTTYSQFDPQGRGGRPYILRDTGDFWDSFNVTIGQGFITITSNPFKTDNNLLEVFGIDIEGLTEQNLEVAQQNAKDLFIDWYRKNLQGA